MFLPYLSKLTKAFTNKCRGAVKLRHLPKMDTKLMVIISLVLGGIFIFWGLLYPKYSEFQDLRDEVEINKQRKTQVEARVASILKEIKRYENINAYDLDQLDKALPKNVDLANLYFYIYSMLSSSGLITENIVIGDTVAELSEDASGEKPDKGEDMFSNAGITITAVGSYASVKDFIQKTEKSLRIADINSIILGVQGGLTGGDGALSVSITLKVYYKP